MSTPVLFYFWSERSQHCLQLTPVLDKLAAEYAGQFILAKVDCDAEQMIASQFGLRSIPTVYLFKDGQPVDGFQGPQPEEAIRDLLQRFLPKEEDLKLAQAQELLVAGNAAEALPLLKDAWQSSQQRSDIGLTLAETQIALSRSEDAEAVLATIPLAAGVSALATSTLAARIASGVASLSTAANIRRSVLRWSMATIENTHRAFYQSGLDIRNVITHRMRAEDFAAGFELMKQGSCGKIVLAKTDAPTRGIATGVFIGMLFVPLYLVAGAWDAGFGLAGWHTLLTTSPGYEPWLRGWRAAIWVHGVAAVPWVVLIVGAGLRTVEAEIEEDAATCASPLRVLWHVTLRRAGAALVVAGLFVLAGVFLDASFFGVAAIIAAVAFGAAMLGLMAVLLTLVSTVRELTTTVQRVTDETVPLLASVNDTVAGVNTELARVDTIVANVQHISGTAENIAEVIHAAVANPLIKAVAFASGTGAALRTARKAKRS